jgi:hypothetical protein
MELEGDCAMEVFVVEETRPAAHGLAHLAGTGTGSSLGSEVSARLLVKPLGELVFLPLAQEILTQREDQPQRTHEFQ